MSLRTARALVAVGVVLFGAAVVVLGALHYAAHLIEVSAP